jgi:hypothetical protein
MKTSIRTLGLAAAASIALALATAACGDSNPTAPSPPAGGLAPPPAPVATFSVSGTISEVTESGSVPLEGAWVVNWATEEAAITDSDGAYIMHGVQAGLAQFIVSKEGYAEQRLELMVDGDMRLDATLDRAESN